MTDRDLYAEALTLADDLRAAGHAEAAATIRLAVEGGATSTEILMDLRWALSQFLAIDTAGDRTTREVASDLRNAIARVLSVDSDPGAVT